MRTLTLSMQNPLLIRVRMHEVTVKKSEKAIRTLIQRAKAQNRAAVSYFFLFFWSTLNIHFFPRIFHSDVRTTDFKC